MKFICFIFFFSQTMPMLSFRKSSIALYLIKWFFTFRKIKHLQPSLFSLHSIRFSETILEQIIKKSLQIHSEFTFLVLYLMNNVRLNNERRFCFNLIANHITHIYFNQFGRVFFVTILLLVYLNENFKISPCNKRKFMEWLPHDASYDKFCIYVIWNFRNFYYFARGFNFQWKLSTTKMEFKNKKLWCWFHIRVLYLTK